MTTDVFSVPVFLIVLRETLETVIIVSVLLAFLSQTLGGPDGNVQVYKYLRRQVANSLPPLLLLCLRRAADTLPSQVWIGVAAGFVVCLVVAGAIIGVFYTLRINSWEAHENYYEGAFCLLASVIITVMGAALLRIGKMQDKWRRKLAKSVGPPLVVDSGRWWSRLAQKYAMFFLPFITVLREGIEAVVFTAGVSFTAPAAAVPLPVFVGLAVGVLVGWILYKCAPPPPVPFPSPPCRLV